MLEIKQEERIKAHILTGLEWGFASILYFLLLIEITVNAPMNGLLPRVGGKDRIIGVGLAISVVGALILPAFYRPRILVSVILLMVYYFASTMMCRATTDKF